MHEYPPSRGGRVFDVGELSRCDLVIERTARGSVCWTTKRRALRAMRDNRHLSQRDRLPFPDKSYCQQTPSALTFRVPITPQPMAPRSWGAFVDMARALFPSRAFLIGPGASATFRGRARAFFWARGGGADESVGRGEGRAEFYLLLPAPDRSVPFCPIFVCHFFSLFSVSTLQRVIIKSFCLGF
ncbi:hypothetical protein N658DRAFT_21165 [Parathielavia hyrcaniae]|uniref:Uncharacterized protein n=1 Tax=Parathielavia hyrcaniae TaxID=113614 RepID=A0AAN6T614_9PEZI|nr:hypothetical protein N658DRAFT_21165 [Parathielavia hyrcaniae]